MMQAGLKPGDAIPRGHGAVLVHDWPEDCHVQGGVKGLVMSRKHPDGHYFTAFFEAFPTNPQTFIRGEGATVTEAEEDAWQKWQRVLACPSGGAHEYETRGYRNGCGFCKHCGLFSSGVFDLGEIGSLCVVCGTPTYWTTYKGKLYCEKHVPDERKRRIYDDSDGDD